MSTTTQAARPVDLRALPKAELHCHLDGILDRAMLRDIRAADPAFPVNPQVFDAAYPVESYDQFWQWWQGINPIEGSLAHFAPILACHIERLKTQNVRYAEIMIASSELPEDIAESLDAVAAFRALADHIGSEQTEVEFMVAFGRGQTPERVSVLTDKWIALCRAGLIVGVALAGQEHIRPAQAFAPTFDRLREAGLGIEIHAGEWCGPESVRDALDYGRPNRIGHGVSAFQDQALLDAIRECGIHLEMCPTSNLRTGSVLSIAAHPIRRALDLGLSFSINTDDPGPFENSMLAEYALLAEHLDFSQQDFEQVYWNSLAARFQR
ncbi:MAG: hypothetical protein JW934_24680 [Anaerolineae bacterium]|nr:hypothetical protein [Anaerolineae bacterium]